MRNSKGCGLASKTPRRRLKESSNAAMSSWPALRGPPKSKWPKRLRHEAQVSRVAVLWSFLFAPSVGVVAHWLIQSGLAWNYLINANHAMALIVMTAVWKQIAYNFIFFLAGLQAIPRSMFEASAMDGAGPFKTFFYVTLPLLSPTAFFLLVVNVVYAFFDTFGIIDASTGGGPGQSTSILVYKVYHDGFKSLDLGSSSAQSVILMIMVVLLTVIQFRFIERRVHYG
ncbi:MAG: ABC transporter permease subunit [Betaproteobacteria bacterium]|nr:ABC transporter permease subunit [Betaproteobacteria bacterium]